MSYISVVLGGVVGSLGRYAINLIPVKSQFPIITLITNFFCVWCGKKISTCML